MRLKRISVSFKLGLLAVLAVVGMSAIATVALWNLNARLYDSAEQRTRAIVDAGHAIVTAYEAEERAGRLPREEAQRRALTALNSIRYGDGDYVFTISNDMRTIGHPSAQMVGRSMADARDSQGRYFTRDMVEGARRNGSTVVEYLWPKPGHEQPVPKLSFARYFPAWEWTLGSGVYLDDVAAAMRRQSLELGAWSLAGGLIVLLVVLMLARNVARPIKRLTDAMKSLAEGNMAVTVPDITRTDEIGDMARTLEVFRENAQRVKQMEADKAEQERRAAAEKRAAMLAMADEFGASVGSAVERIDSASGDMRQTAGDLTATAEETARQSNAVSEAATQASTNVQTVAAATEELSASIAEISRRVAETAQMASRAVDQTSRTDQQVQTLNEAATSIGAVVKLINDIAGQTNLLALNATIEAARAGEAGKGFAVVASEVKSLANQTAKATEEISGQIAQVQAATTNVVEAIKEIGTAIGEINGVATSIASAVEEQGAATREISRNVQEAAQGTGHVSSNIAGVSNSAKTTGSAAERALAASTELGNHAAELRRKVDGFLTKIKAA